MARDSEDFERLGRSFAALVERTALHGMPVTIERDGPWRVSVGGTVVEARTLVASDILVDALRRATDCIPPRVG